MWSVYQISLSFSMLGNVSTVESSLTRPSRTTGKKVRLPLNPKAGTSCLNRNSGRLCLSDNADRPDLLPGIFGFSGMSLARWFLAPVSKKNPYKYERLVLFLATQGECKALLFSGFNNRNSIQGQNYLLTMLCTHLLEKKKSLPLASWLNHPTRNNPILDDVRISSKLPF